MPWQHFKEAAALMAIDARALRVSRERTHVKGINEIDTGLVKEVIAKMGNKEAKVYKHIATRGAWSEAHLHEIGLAENCECPHCGVIVSDVTHVT